MSLNYFHRMTRAWRCCSVLITLLLLANTSHASNHYITFNDGHVLVFPDQCIQSMNTTDSQVIITDLNGSTYNYLLADIDAVSTEFTGQLPSFTSFVFDNKVNFQVISDAIGTITDTDIMADVIGIGKWLTPTFELSDPRARAMVDGKEQVSAVSRLYFDTCRVYTVYFPGDLILSKDATGAIGFQPFGKTYDVTAVFLTDYSSTVPRIDINTVGGVNITSKTEYVDAEIIINGAGVFPSMTDSVQIRGRGHTSWSNDPDAKNPYRLKFDSKKRPLGLPRGKNWVLLANKISGSMLTNAIGMKAASLIGTAAPNHIIPVELYINGVYKGNYNFTEKVGISSNSIQVDDDFVSTLIKLDCNYDEVATQKFRSTPYNHYCNIKDPDFAEGNTFLTLNMIRDRFNAFCQAVQDSVNLADYVDIDYLARYLMLNEFICNYEIFHPKSGYCYNENILDDNSKFIFGPGWDFDWSFGYQTNRNHYNCRPEVDYYNIYNWGQSAFFKRLRNHPLVVRRLYELWKDFVENDIDELCDFCTEYYEYARPSLEHNKQEIGDNTNYGTQHLVAAYWLWHRATHLLEVMRAEVIKPGDIDGDGDLTINDVVTLINYLLKNDTQSVDMEIADVDSDGAMTIQDVTALIGMLLSNSH